LSGAFDFDFDFDFDFAGCPILSPLLGKGGTNTVAPSVGCPIQAQLERGF
jgi:hypothetical protein